MKQIIYCVAILCALALAFLWGSYYTLRYQSVSYDAETGLYIMSACWQSEYYCIEAE